MPRLGGPHGGHSNIRYYGVRCLDGMRVRNDLAFISDRLVVIQDALDEDPDAITVDPRSLGVPPRERDPRADGAHCTSNDPRAAQIASNATDDATAEKPDKFGQDLTTVDVSQARRFLERPFNSS